MAPELSPQLVQPLLRRERLAQVGRLLRGVVHNLSGGLQMLRLPLDLLELKLAQGQTQDLGSKLAAIHHGFDRTNSEVDLLAAKASQLQGPAEAPLDLSQLAQEELNFWRADMYFKHEVQLETDLPEATPKCQAAYLDVALAFNVLVANALEAMSPAGAHNLRVRWRQEQGTALLSVADDGPGPSPGMVPRMFEAFSGDKGGAHDGLGLFLAKAALAPWGGDILWQAGPPPLFSLALPLIKT
jgi:C4-dicarboxylate-specific signal transduction histidine kinase